MTSTAVSLTPLSRKKGILFTARAAVLEAELDNLKLQADFGDHLIPMNNLLEPQVADRALAALDNFIIETTGAKLGSLYEDAVQDSINDLERMYAELKANKERADAKTTYIPLPTSEAAPSGEFKLAARREKEKTRPSAPSSYLITALAETPTINITVPPTQLTVKAATAATFAALFYRSEARGSVAWTAFESAMADLGFSVTPKGGSRYTYNPPDSMDTRPIMLHRPHASELEGDKLLTVARMLQRAYGWTADTFVVA